MELTLLLEIIGRFFQVFRPFFSNFLNILLVLFVISGWSKILGDQIGVKMDTSKWQETGATIVILRAMLCLRNKF